MKFLRADGEIRESDAIEGFRVVWRGLLLGVEDEDLEPTSGMMTRDGIGEDPRVREVVARDDSEGAERAVVDETSR